MRDVILKHCSVLVGIDLLWSGLITCKITQVLPTLEVGILNYPKEEAWSSYAWPPNYEPQLLLFPFFVCR
jgi:hypothetical protein